MSCVVYLKYEIKLSMVAAFINSCILCFDFAPSLSVEIWYQLENQRSILSLLSALLPLPLNISLNTALMVCTTDTYLFSALHFMIILSRQVMRTAQY